MNKAIKYITSLKEWEEVENVLIDEIQNLLDVRNVDKDELATSRASCAKTLMNFLHKIELLSQEPEKITPKSYK